MNLLDYDAMVQLTGSSQPKRQKEVLKRNGIYFIERLDGKIVTTWHHVNHPLTHDASNDDMPDFSKMS